MLTVAGSALVVGAVGPTPEASAAGLEPFGDCDALAEWSVDVLGPLVGPFGLAGGGGMMGVAGAPEMARAAAPGTAVDTQSGGAESAQAEMPTTSDGDAVGPGSTGTNLQEAGVDEPDIVKTDGRLVITTVDDELVVLDVSGAEPVRLGSVPVPAMGWALAQPTPFEPDIASGAPDGPVSFAGGAELLLVGDRVVVLSTSWYSPETPDAPGAPEPDEPSEPDRPGLLPGVAEDTPEIAPAPGTTGPTTMPTLWAPTVATTTVTVVDVADPAAPRVVTATELEGAYVSARESGGVVRLVVSSTPVLPFVTSRTTEYGPDGQPIDETALKANRAVLESAPGEAFLPHTVVRDENGTVTDRRPAMGCASVSHPVDPSGTGTITVATLDVGGASDGTDPLTDTVGVSADGDLVYASADRLYVATTRGGWAAMGMPRDDSGGSNSGGSNSGGSDVRTALHGFDVSDPAGARYLVSGDVDGYLLGRWALSARDGYLRVATTRGDMWGGSDDTDSAVTVLAEQNGALAPVGEVSGLGVGEQIRAVRWFDDTAVVVTFRQTDPLYVLDLADPAAPALTGELKIPGYSAYLHPIGDSRLLGVGQDATETGMTTGVQVSTFDLSDPAAPTRLDVLTEPDTYSAVENDSRLFTYLPERGLALLPIDGRSGSSLRAVHVDEAGSLAEVGAHYAESSPESWSFIQRAVAVDDGRVAVLAQGGNGPALTLLALDDLAAVGSTDLGTS